MSAFNFTYKLPENFNKRVIQYLQQFESSNIAAAFNHCNYEFEDLGLAYYAGLKGDNWDKHAIDITFEGIETDIVVLKHGECALRQAIGKALKTNESGLLLKNVFFFEDNALMETVKLPPTNADRLEADIKTAGMVLSDLIQIGERICLSHLYNEKSLENDINDAIRDMLFMKGYNEVKDQSRHGISASGTDAGEVDILLTKSGKEIAILEGLRLDSVKTAYIDAHIEKALINYNSLGTSTFIVGYVNTANFELFWNRYTKHIQNYNFPLPVERAFYEETSPNAAIRVASIILSKDGYAFPVYFMAFKIC